MKNAFKSSLMLVLALLASNTQAGDKRTFKVAAGAAVAAAWLYNRYLAPLLDDDLYKKSNNQLIGLMVGGVAMMGAGFLYDKYWSPVSVEQVFDAIRLNDIACVQRYINEGGDINARNEFGRQLLDYSIRCWRIEIVQLLIAQSGIDVGRVDLDGFTLLHWASSYGHVEIARLLLEKHGMDMNVASNDGLNSLDLAAGQGHIEMVRLLLAQPGININAWVRALDIALIEGYEEIAEMLREHARWTPERAAWIRVAAGVGVLNDEAHARMVASLD